MSRERFSKQMADDIAQRFYSLENYDSYTFFDRNDTFMLALAIAYMTLSKDSIIKKDYDNHDRTDTNRLTPHVEVDEIESLFNSSNSPTIISSDVSDYTWILDNIRDCILHEHFDIDGDNRIIHIDNPMYGKKLVADIPFDWFFNYIENDILSKRFTKRFTSYGFYYNSVDDVSVHPDMRRNYGVKDNCYFAVANHILYKVNIVGDKVPIKEAESTVHALFRQYANLEVTDEDIERYEGRIPLHRGIYSLRYLVSYLKARELVLRDLKNIYPDCQIDIQMDERKRKLTNKFRRSNRGMRYSYDDLFEKLNNIFLRKGITELNVISRLYDCVSSDYAVLEDCDDYSFAKLVFGDDFIPSDDVRTNYHTLMQAKGFIRDTLFQVYGLAILAINKSSIEESNIDFLDQHVEGYSADSYKRFAEKRRSLYGTILDKKFLLSEVIDQHSKCPLNVRPFLEEKISYLNAEIDRLSFELHVLETSTDLEIIDSSDKKSITEERYQIMAYIDQMIGNFERCPYDSMHNGQHSKILIKKIILSMIDRLALFESEHYVASCSPEETLELIRNCFSHIGRVKVANYTPYSFADIFFYDFSNDNKISGIVKGNYTDFVRFLGNCLSSDTLEDIDTRVL